VRWGFLRAGHRESQSRGATGIADQAAGVVKVAWLDLQRIWARQDDQLDVLGEAGDVSLETAVEHHAESVNRGIQRRLRGPLEGAAAAVGRQDVDPLRPQLDGVRDRRVVQDRAVDQAAFTDWNRGKQSWDRCGRADRVHGRAGGQQHLAPLDHVERQNVQRGLRVGEVVELDVAPYELPESLVGHKVVSPAGQTADEREQVDGKYVVSPEATPDARERAARLDGLRTRGDERSVERADGGRDQQVRVDPLLEERAQHSDLQRTQARAAREDECGARAPIHATTPAEGIQC
jgi:hypothetical protein